MECLYLRVGLGLDVRADFKVIKVGAKENLNEADNLSVIVSSMSSPTTTLPCTFELNDSDTVSILVKAEDLKIGEYRIEFSYTKVNSDREPSDEPFCVDVEAFKVVAYNSDLGGYNTSPYLTVQQVELSATLSSSYVSVSSSSGGGSSVKSIVTNYNGTTEMESNTEYQYESNAEEITMLLSSGTEGVVNSYTLRFTTGSTPPTVTLPEGVTWINHEPIIESNCTYLIEIEEGLATIQGTGIALAHHDFIEKWNTACGDYGSYNTTTKYFELNGLDDITYDQAVEIYTYSNTYNGETNNVCNRGRTNIPQQAGYANTTNDPERSFTNSFSAPNAEFYRISGIIGSLDHAFYDPSSSAPITEIDGTFDADKVFSSSDAAYSPQLCYLTDFTVTSHTKNLYFNGLPSISRATLRHVFEMKSDSSIATSIYLTETAYRYLTSVDLGYAIYMNITLVTIPD